MPVSISHQPVLLKESVEWLDVRAGKRICDLTLGCGGHTRAFLEAVGPKGFVLGIDRDGEILKETLANLRREGYGEERFEAAPGSFRDIDRLTEGMGLESFDGFMADLGVNSLHFEQYDRGFSFREDGKLDMRFDRNSGQPLGEILATLDERSLRGILRKYGEEIFADRIAHAILKARDEGRLTGTLALTEVVRAAYPARARRESRIDPATKSYQALRIFVNDELTAIRIGLVKVMNGMKAGARLVVLSYHSLEDRIAKRLFRAACEGKKDFYGHRSPAPARELIRKPLTPGEAERQANPRSTSAKMRAMEKLEGGVIEALNVPEALP
ncbi:MAG: 16S rRNA (cytosine(1402)-N(4))-methyltransferase RsmH [Candidatus Sumerlaeota bacterium]|nr:16S rRNA (cytosine(1402)-N(4))-methyltransferase RsmH [Candidatus Sumerlaeota bacterium]